jgi:hypothetical protein
VAATTFLGSLVLLRTLLGHGFFQHFPAQGRGPVILFLNVRD